MNEWYSSRQLWLQKWKDKLDILKNIREKLDNNLIYQIDIVFDMHSEWNEEVLLGYKIYNDRLNLDF